MLHLPCLIIPLLLFEKAWILPRATPVFLRWTSYIVLKTIRKESAVARLHVVLLSRGFTKTWTNSLCSPTFRHFHDHLVIRVLPDYLASICCEPRHDLSLLLLFSDRMGTLLTDMWNLMTALRRSFSSFCPPSMI